MRLLGVLSVAGVALVLIRLLACPSTYLVQAKQPSPAAPSLTPEEVAAGFRIGAGRDEFRVITDVRTAGASAARLEPAARVLATVVGEEARAYPLAILNHHEMVTDRVGGVPLLASY